MIDSNMNYDTIMIEDPALEETTTTKRKRPSVHQIPQEERVPCLKRVRFAMDQDDNGSENSNDRSSTEEDGGRPPWRELTEGLCQTLWYTGSDINAMKQDAKRILLNRTEATEEDLVGLERFNVQRALWKRSAIQYVLMAQKQRKGDEDFLQGVSLRCSGWAREMAMKQGFRDYCAVHDPLASLFDGPEEENYNDCFFSDVVRCNKRKNITNDEEVQEEENLGAVNVRTPERSVRQRTASAVEEDDDLDTEPVPAIPAL
jgi:hypothetical protein